MKHQPFIVKRRFLLKGLFLVGASFLGAAFALPPKVIEKLSRLPYVGRFFKKEKPPENLSQKAFEALEEAYWEGAPFYSPELWEKALKYYRKGRESLTERNYVHARFYFEKAIDYARKAREKSLQKQKELYDQGEKKFARIIARWRETKFRPDERLNWEIRLRYLRELLEKGRYEEFFKEAEKIEKDLAKLPKKEGAQKGPFPSSTKIKRN